MKVFYSLLKLNSLIKATHLLPLQVVVSKIYKAVAEAQLS